MLGQWCELLIAKTHGTDVIHRQINGIDRIY